MTLRTPKTADTPADPDRHGTSDMLNRYIDSLIADGKRNVIDERNRAVTDLTGKWNKNISDLVGRRNSEIESLRAAMPNPHTSFSTGAGLTAGGYGLGRLAALSKHIGRARGGRAGLVGAGLTAGGLMLKDRLMPGKGKLPGVVADKWVDPLNPQKATPDPNLWRKIQNLIGMKPLGETRRWVTDKKYPSTIAGGTPKPAPAEKAPTPDPSIQTAGKTEPQPSEKKTGSIGLRALLIVSNGF